MKLWAWGKKTAHTPIELVTDGADDNACGGEDKDEGRTGQHLILHTEARVVPHAHRHIRTLQQVVTTETNAVVH